MPDDFTDFNPTLENTTRALLQRRAASGGWEGKLSSSALSTATAVFALSTFEHNAGASINAERRAQLRTLAQRGVQWLCTTQNADGGWGDTVLSISNISTTALCWAALAAGGEPVSATVQKAESWLVRATGSLEPAALAGAIKARYGKDRTFSVPILTMCALAGRLGEGRDAWRSIPQLPFELAACPHQWFQWLRLPVVSYALPALIAIGQVRHVHCPTGNWPARMVRQLTRNRTLRLLEQIQPKGGGFLEATPLTSFVVMSLVGSGQVAHPVTIEGIDFLARSACPDGSWPIDTNLSTWVTTLSVNALAQHPEYSHLLTTEDRRTIRDLLVNQQFRVEHLYTHAPPGAWAWTDLPGGVPDADDTAGALLALWNLGLCDAPTLDAVAAGINWLLNLQNRDGGIPTFCRGWGNLPFDRSGSDLTAHALHAWTVWRDRVSRKLQARIDNACARGLTFLRKQQREDGAWTPLWFGNQFAPDDENPVYGTSRVLAALCAMTQGANSDTESLIRGGIAYLTQVQNSDGGWGGARATLSSIEETSLATQALAACVQSASDIDKSSESTAVERGLNWLDRRTRNGTLFTPTPIGFYFAKLWYFERDYPLIFCCGAFGRALRKEPGTPTSSNAMAP